MNDLPPTFDADDEWSSRFRTPTPARQKEKAPHPPRAPRPPRPPHPARGHRVPLLPLLAVFLLVLGARLWLIQTYGNATPYWDQWDAEAATLLKPWREGWITPGHFWAPHAEHRIVFTRLETLGLTWLNGQWDPGVEMVFNAALAAGVAVALAVFLRRALPPGGRWWPLAVAALVAALFAAPFAWENILAGFQGQFYFLLGFTLAALGGLGLGRPGSAGWWGGTAAALAACFSMGSGFTAAGVALGWLVLRLLHGRRRPGHGEWATAAVCLAVVTLGLAIRHDPPAHAPLKAENLAAWLRALGRCLAWPRVREPGWGLLMWLPWVGLAVAWLRRPRRSGPDAAADAPRVPVPPLLLGTWLLVQFAAMAYARGANNDPPVSRYFDLLGLGALVNVLALLWLATHAFADRRPLPRALTGTAAALWLGFLAWGAADLARVEFNEEMPKKRAWGQAEEANVRAYVATGNMANLRNKPYLDIPYPDPDRLAKLLDDPTLRALLPANIRAPLRLGSGAAPGPFHPDGLPPGSPAATDRAPGRPALGSFASDGTGATATGELRAALVPAPTLPYLRWETAAIEGKELVLGARDAHTGVTTRLDSHRPAVAGDRWRVDHLALPAPPGDAVEVIAADRTPAGWLAFREPTEEGALSYRAGWLARRSARVLALGGLVAALAVIGGLLSYRTLGTSKVWFNGRAIPDAGSTAQTATRPAPAPSVPGGR